jgi:alpha-1,3-rhamnosyl/mannosyltransferase
MTLNIGLVARCLNTAHVRGMGKYLAELLRQSEDYPELSWYLFADNVHEQMHMPETSRIRHDVFTFRGDRYRLWEQIGLPLRVLKRRADLLHCTENTLSYWQPKPTVVTVHDTLIWDEVRENRAENFYYNRLLPAALNKCAEIITISQSSKNDILAKWPAFESKLSVIYHGISEEYFADEPIQMTSDLQRFTEAVPYLLYLGGPMERKRLAWALEVLARCPVKPLKLVVCGFGAEARQSAYDRLPPELRDRVYFAGYLSDAELRSLYRGAKAVLYPTLYEGFGFPAIEAQAAGTPAIFSALGSLRELIGPLANVVPPYDMEAWLAAVSDALAMGERRIEKAREARVWASQFRWSTCFEQHLAVYRRISEHRSGQSK